MTDRCIIFDLDGTLVDSEGLNHRAYLDLLPELDDSIEELIGRYRGQKLAPVLADLAQRLGRSLPDGFATRYRERVAELFAQELKPVPGAREMLEAIEDARCVASSGPVAKIAHALEVSGLAPFFEGRVFSSYEIDSWKPEPGLFLHAARSMGFEPEQCIVIEDSDVGVEAAIAAGMKVLRYAPNGGVTAFGEVVSFAAMSLLPALLKEFTPCDRS